MREPSTEVSTAEPQSQATVVPPRIEVDDVTQAGQERHGDLEVKMSVRNLDFWYGKSQALFDNSIDYYQNRVTAIIGPSGCGKSTHIRCLNRIYELYRDHKASGEIVLDGKNILGSGVDVLDVRRRVGMIFQKPSPFPMTVFENIAYGLKLFYKLNRGELRDRVEDALRRAALWDEVKDKLNEPGTGLSGGQQQRLCIARTIATEPEVVLMDEPCSAIDPIATGKIEDLIEELKHQYTILIVTHNMQQAARVSEYTAFFFQGYIVEFGETTKLFSNPDQKQTEDYITGRFG
ncbi:MAG: phosphate ABC transporter ATP-binding protein PstB [Actinobacteria bacterium]|nr:phosphate ABC transporter ATP-binding protein PstB [Actinomycetota bacterium]